MEAKVVFGVPLEQIMKRPGESRVPTILKDMIRCLSDPSNGIV